jgi:hypothetical protein
MNPDQPPVPTPEQTPPPAPIEPQVAPEPAPTPEQPQQATSVAVPTPPVATPVVSPFGTPVNTVSSDVTTPSTTQQQSVSSVPVPVPKKSRKKLFIMIGAIVAGVVVIGVAAWLLITFIAANSLALKTYTGDTYSILVPTSYKADTSDGKDVTFKSLDSKDASTTSQEAIQESDIPTGERDAYISEIDKTFTQSTLTSSLTSGGNTIENFSITKITQSGQEARKIHADIKKDGKYTGTVDMIIVFGTDKSYLVGVSTYVTQPALKNSASKILNSFAIK